MKSIIIITYCLILTACSDLKESKNENNIVAKRKTDVFLENLEKKHSNYKDNTISRQNMTKDLDKLIDSIYKLGFLDDIPVKVFKMGKSKKDNGVVIQFYTKNYNIGNTRPISDRLNFEVIGIMDEEKALLLKENQNYLISGKMIKRLDHDAVFSIVSQVYYSPKTEIDKEGLYDENYHFNIGNFLMKIEDATPVN